MWQLVQQQVHKTTGALQGVSAMPLVGKASSRMFLGKNQAGLSAQPGWMCPSQGCGLDRGQQRAVAALGLGSWRDEKRKFFLSPASGVVSQPVLCRRLHGTDAVCVIWPQFVLFGCYHGPPCTARGNLPAAFSTKGNGLKSAERSGASPFSRF